MDTIVDLRSRDGDHELLTQTAVSGRIRTEALLGGAPLSSHLDENETPKYVLRNKKSGVEVEQGESARTMAPDDGYQALALVTDMRVLFVIGTGDGDKTGEVQLADIVQAKSEDSGFRSTALVLETLDERTWSFPCRGDTADVASFVDDIAQTWASAERQADEVESQLREANELVQAGEYDAAGEQISGVKPTLETVIRELQGVGPAAAEHARQRAEPLAQDLLELQGPVRAQAAGRAHAAAQDAWDEGEYERAAAAYDRVVTGYERAMERESGPANQQLADRRRSAIRERELLRVAPLVEADTARRRARKIDEPGTAATKWEDVLSRYRQVLDLEWPGDGSFLATTERLREQAASAAEDAIDDYYEAGRRRLGSADEFSVDGRTQRADVLYERAREQFQQAKQLATEAQPDRVDELDEAIRTVEHRLAGNAPTAQLPVEELPITEVDVAGGDDGPEASDGEPTAETEYDESSVIGRIQSQKTGDRNTENGSEADDRQPADHGEPITNTEIRRKLHDLDQERFTEFVADLWEAQGWSTTVFSTTNQVVYDIVAMRDEPEQRRLLLWTEHRGDDEQVGPRTIERCATARDSSQGADSATLVTNALLRTAAKQRADGLDVTVIDGSDLVELVRFEGFLDRLDRDGIEN
jgi:tetratricopeptide (TPR) repeat protein